MAAPSDKTAGMTGPPDPDEMARWMARYGPALRRYFTRRIGPGHAEDLVQDVFVRLQARADHAPLENVERFVFAIAKRVLVDRYRFDVAHAAKLHDPIDTAENLADDLSPERILEARQEYDRALMAIVELPPRMRQAFILHRFGKLSYSAIAKRMNISKSSVQVLMERAIERFMQNLEGRS